MGGGCGEWEWYDEMGAPLLNGRAIYGQRGGKANPNVQWHTMRAVAQREGWLDEFRQNYPKPEKKKQQQELHWWDSTVCKNR